MTTGVTRQLTAGQHNVYVQPSDDGRKLLLTISTTDVTKRPFGFSTILLVDTETLQADTIVQKDGFISYGTFSYDGRYIAFKGSPEAFNGIGNTLSADKIPYCFEYELFLYDIASKQIKCLTRNFDPSIIDITWSKTEGCIYALTEDKDLQTLYRINPQNGKITPIKTSEFIQIDLILTASGAEFTE